jgi:NAD dependent epimerase/dehydratase family enzyme
MKNEERPKVFVSGSAIGIYPFTDDPVDESFDKKVDNV